MKYKKAWKLCGVCEKEYVTVEYSLFCPECRKEIDSKMGLSETTSRRYEREVWENERERFEWTLIGTQSQNAGLFDVRYIYDCWPEELRDRLTQEAKEAGLWTEESSKGSTREPQEAR